MVDGIPSPFKEILIEIIASLIVGALAWIRKRYLVALGRKDPRLTAISFFVLLALWAIVNILIFYIVSRNTPDYSFSLITLGFILTSSPMFFLMWHELNQFWSVGLRGADHQIRQGIDYQQALEMCQNQLAVLGTGAAKLTREPEFKKALLRCRPDRPIRFLLTKPTDDNLASAARRAGKAKDEFAQIVLESLKRIADIRKRRGLNIEVRFYPENPIYRPIFRLMFIDNSICLASYNVFGEGDGSQLLQLHVVKAPEQKRVVESFYYPLELYFEWLWDLSEPWDFVSYLEPNG